MGESNRYAKTLEVKYLTKEGATITENIILSRASDNYDIKKALNKAVDPNEVVDIERIISVNEVMSKGGSPDKYHWFVLDKDLNKIINAFEKGEKHSAELFINDFSGNNSYKLIAKRTMESMGLDYDKGTLFDGGNSSNKDNGYIAFYKGKQLEVHAETSLKARDKAAAMFKAKKAYDVTVVLAEKNGEQVTHNPMVSTGGEVSIGEYDSSIGNVASLVSHGAYWHGRILGNDVYIDRLNEVLSKDIKDSESAYKEMQEARDLKSKYEAENLFFKENFGGEKGYDFWAENFSERDELPFAEGGSVGAVRFSDNKSGSSKKDNSLNYMLLDRMRSDCEYFLGNGDGHEGVLHQRSVDGQIAEMKKIWNDLPKDEKPEWLNMDGILDYETKMKDKIKLVVSEDDDNPTGTCANPSCRKDIYNGGEYCDETCEGSFAEGGSVDGFKYDPEIDYLEQYELLPLFVRDIILSDEFEEPSYADNEIVLEKLKPLGWTFEYGLDSMPYSLRPIGEPEQEFAKGGSVSKVWGVEARKTNDSYWEQLDENLSKSDADKLVKKYKDSGDYYTVKAEIPLPFAEGGSTKPKAKHKIGEKVYYIEKLSGFDNSKPLEVEFVKFKEFDDLERSMDLEDRPHYHYIFKDSNLGAEEGSLSKTKPENKKIAKDGEIEFDTKPIKGESKQLKNYTHFGIHKPTNSIVYNWDYKGYDKEELDSDKDSYFWQDIKDEVEANVDKFKKSDYAIIERKNLSKKGIDLNDYLWFQGQKYADGGVVKKAKSGMVQKLKIDACLKDGKISSSDLEKICGHKPKYPKQTVGRMKFEKCFMSPHYKLIK